MDRRYGRFFSAGMTALLLATANATAQVDVQLREPGHGEYTQCGNGTGKPDGI